MQKIRASFSFILGVFLLVCGFTVLSTPTASASTCTFASAGDNNFNNDDNWGACGATPGAGDVVIIPAATSVTLSFPATVGSLYVTGTLSAVGQDLTVNGATLIDPLGTVTSTIGTLTFTGAVSSTGALGTSYGRMFFGSTFQNNKTFDIGSDGGVGAAATTTGALTNAVGATIFLRDGMLSLLGNFSDFGTITIGTSGSGPMMTRTGKIRFAGTGNQTIAPGFSPWHDLISIKSSGTATIIGSDLTLYEGSLTSTGAGTINFGSNSLLVGQTTTIDAGTVTSTSGILHFGGAASSTGFIGTSSGSIQFDAAVQNNGTIDVGSGILNGFAFTNAGTINLRTGRLEIPGDFSNTGTINALTGTVELVDGFDQLIDFGTSLLSTLENTKSLGTALLTASTTVLGEYISNPGIGTVTLGAGTTAPLTIVGTSTIYSGILTTYAGTLTLGIVTSTGTVRSDTGDILINGTFNNLGNFQVGVGATATTTGAVSNSGTITLYTGTLSALSDLSGNGDMLFGAGSLRLAGTANQTVYVAASLLNDLESIKTSGTVSFSASTTILGNFSATGTLTTMTSLTNAFTVVGTTNLVSGTVTSTTGKLNFIGAVSSTGAIGSSTGNMSFGSTVRNNGTLDFGSGTATSTGTLTNAGTIYGRTSTIVFPASFVNTGTFTRGTSTVNFTSDSAANVAGVSYYLLKFTGNGTYTLAASTTAVATTTIESGATLALSTNRFNASGDISNAGLITAGAGGVLAHPADYLRVLNASLVETSSFTTGDTFNLVLRDDGRNFDGTSVETLTIPVTAGTDSETLTLTETGAATGIFRRSSNMEIRRMASPAASDGVLGLSSAGTLLAAYTDAQDGGDTTSTSATVALGAVTEDSGGGGGGGGGAVGSSVGIPLSSVIPPAPSTTPLPPIIVTFLSPDATPVSTAPVVPAPEPSSAIDTTTRAGLLEALGLSPDTAAEARARTSVRADAREFATTLSAAQTDQMVWFVAYGGSALTRRLGEGERRSVLRDGLQTIGAGASVADLEAMANGQRPTRNLTNERVQLPRVRATFRTIYGHDPNFQSTEENLAWNVLMYRIRFTRNLALERQGILDFRATFGRNPQTPAQWAAVRVMGYVQR